MNHFESKLQQNCVKYFKLQFPNKMIFAIPNGGKRNLIEAKIMKAEGVMPGVADLFIPEVKWGDNFGYLHSFGLFIEMKFGSGKQTDSQKLFEKNITDRGYKYEICRSFDEFMNVVNEYFGVMPAKSKWNKFETSKTENA